MATNIGLSNKPSIKIYFDDSCISQDKFKEIMLGIEEEGIPYEIKGCSESDVINLGYEASLDSNLGVGIGVSKDTIILHYNKLEKNSPLYTIKTSSNSSKMRALGSNAARLVIKMPFKDMK
ncbi:MAG: glycerol dehydratase reactivase beta/small subunit family protein [Romboutsia sp.]|uniref:glycerol dehydratase reactivase beta/small subunit family protein n=1 Tax=Romboutsia sp. TaxID=1965302 RepID=UPI003F3DD5D5